MDRITRLCDEVHAFDGIAERTGAAVELRGLKAHKRTCTSITDLIRKYKLYGDGLFYLPAGLWPEGETQISLDNVKWVGLTHAYNARLRSEKSRVRRRAQDPDE
jgi:hypothetical protein